MDIFIGAHIDSFVPEALFPRSTALLMVSTALVHAMPVALSLPLVATDQVAAGTVVIHSHADTIDTIICHFIALLLLYQ